MIDHDQELRLAVEDVRLEQAHLTVGKDAARAASAKAGSHMSIRAAVRSLPCSLREELVHA